MLLNEFLERIAVSEHAIYIKRLAANDTGATGAHQAGPYLPKEVAFALVPSLGSSGANPDCVYTTYVASHDVNRNTRLVWYNQQSRDECRITRWADEGRRNSPITPDQTGAIAVFAFATDGAKGVSHSWAWICSDEEQEALVESRFGDIEPGTSVFRHRAKTSIIRRRMRVTSPCKLPITELPPTWIKEFPDTSTIVEKTLELLPMSAANPDLRLVKRRECEFELFQTVEAAHVLPQVQVGFRTIDAFVTLANSVTNRRKSRSGRSLELHLERIFLETKIQHSHGARTEAKSTPDFLFPSASHYADRGFDEKKLRMLGAKTTCKDRWRQVLNEASRIRVKHIATLQEGVSEDQFAEMKRAGVVLVVPKSLHKSYPQQIRGELRTLSQFLKEIESLQR